MRQRPLPNRAPSCWDRMQRAVDDHRLRLGAGRGRLFNGPEGIVRCMDLGVVATELVKEFYRRLLSRLRGRKPGSITPPHESSEVREALPLLGSSGAVEGWVQAFPTELVSGLKTHGRRETLLTHRTSPPISSSHARLPESVTVHNPASPGPRHYMNSYFRRRSCIEGNWRPRQPYAARNR
jgi:hypothetical protein